MFEKFIAWLRKLEEEQIVSLITLPLSLIFALIAIIKYGLTFTSLGYIVFDLIVILLVPYLVVLYWKSRKVLAMENFFPALLRNLSESKKAGMSLVHAIKNAANAYYGPLTKEIKKVNALISWGVPLPEALNYFRNRVKYSKKMYRGLSIILETYYAGGDIASAMENVAESTETIKKLEKDRESLLQQQALIIYVVHGVFIGVIVMLYKVLIPLISVQGSLSLASQFMGVENPSANIEFYRTLFLLALSIQSIASGIVIGETKEGSAIAGFKYVIILFGLSMAAYAIFILPKNIELDVNVDRKVVAPNSFIQLAGSVTYEGRPAKEALVKVYLDGSEAIEIKTKEDGSFIAKVKVPSEARVYNLKVIASYQGSQAKRVIPIEVSG